MSSVLMFTSDNNHLHDPNIAPGPAQSVVSSTSPSTAHILLSRDFLGIDPNTSTTPLQTEATVNISC